MAEITPQHIIQQIINLGSVFDFVDMLDKTLNTFMVDDEIDNMLVDVSVAIVNLANNFTMGELVSSQAFKVIGRACTELDQQGAMDLLEKKAGV